MGTCILENRVLCDSVVVNLVIYSNFTIGIMMNKFYVMRESCEKGNYKDIFLSWYFLVWLWSWKWLWSYVFHFVCWFCYVLNGCVNDGLSEMDKEKGKRLSWDSWFIRFVHFSVFNWKFVKAINVYKRFWLVFFYEKQILLKRSVVNDMQMMINLLDEI